MFFSFGPFDFAQGNACFNRWLECVRCTEIGRALIFDILVSDFESAAVVKTLACQATGSEHLKWVENKSAKIELCVIRQSPEAIRGCLFQSNLEFRRFL